jgi:hypothetical protein
MAINNGGVYGRNRNKAGGVVWFKWNALQVFREYVAQISNPRTDKQQIVRARFKTCMRIARMARRALNVAMHSICRSMSNTVYGWCVKKNWEAVSATSPDDVTINWAEVKVSEGNCDEVSWGAVDWGAEEHLTIAATFNGNVSETNNADDEVYMLAVVPELNQSILSSPAVRSAGAISLECPAGWNGMTVHLYGFTVSKDEGTMGMPSDSAYVGHHELE